jgi:hypothetical protein
LEELEASGLELDLEADYGEEAGTGNASFCSETYTSAFQ